MIRIKTKDDDGNVFGYECDGYILAVNHEGDGAICTTSQGEFCTELMDIALQEHIDDVYEDDEAHGDDEDDEYDDDEVDEYLRGWDF